MIPATAGKGLDDLVKLPGVTGLTPVWVWSSVWKRTVSVVLSCLSVTKLKVWKHLSEDRAWDKWSEIRSSKSGQWTKRRQMLLSVGRSLQPYHKVKGFEGWSSICACVLQPAPISVYWCRDHLWLERHSHGKMLQSEEKCLTCSLGCQEVTGAAWRGHECSLGPASQEPAGPMLKKCMVLLPVASPQANFYWKNTWHFLLQTKSFVMLLQDSSS